MSRVLGSLAAVAALGGAALCQSPAAPSDRPNVVLIISDDHGYGDYGWMGHPHIKTPNLDKMASEGMVFRRAHVTTALCGPSLVSLLTGLYTHQHRKVDNLGGGKELVEHLSKCPRFPAILSAAGYRCLGAGKTWMDHEAAGFLRPRSMPPPTGPTQNPLDEQVVQKGGSLGGMQAMIGRAPIEPIFEFIEETRKQGKPFLVWFAPYIPHSPHSPPPRLLEKYLGKTGMGEKKEAYYAMVEWMDGRCGQILDYLDRTGLRKNTLVLYIVDNGVGGEGNRGGKSKAYEGGLATPIILNWPGHVKPKMDTTSLASGVDIAPTILSACGLKPPPEMAGINLLDAEAVAKRQAVFAASFRAENTDVKDQAKTLTARVCFQGPWKLILWKEGRAELFDLFADPAEKNDLADQHPQRVAEMTRRIAEWWSISDKEKIH